MDEAAKFYQNNKIPVFLLRDNNIKDIVQYLLEFDSTIDNSIINKIAVNDEIAKNQFWFTVI